MNTKSFKDLVVWQRSIELVKHVYKAVEQLPKTEVYALGDQLRRASVSVPSNIAEGYRRNNLQEYIQFCSIASGSLGETETQLILATELYKIDVSEAMSCLNEVQKMLIVMIKKLKEKRSAPR